MDAVIVSAVAALSGVLLGSMLSRNAEYRKWLRAERHAAIVELLATGEAMRRSQATRVLAQLRGETESVEQARHEAFAATQERLYLALSAVELLFPARVAELAEQFGDAAREVWRVSAGTPAQTPSPGDRYHAARAALTAEVRMLVAPSAEGRPITRKAGL